MNVAQQQMKLVLVGDQNVGKTSLLRYLVDSKPLNDPVATTSIYLTVHQLQVRGNPVNVNIWDTAGEEQYRSLASVYLRSAKGVLIVFDLTARSSFESVQYWLKYIDDTLEVTPATIVVGNKCDCGEQDIADDRIAEFCRTKGVRFMKTSAATGENVQEVFTQLVEDVLDTVNLGNAPQIQLVHPEPAQRICC